MAKPKNIILLVVDSLRYDSMFRGNAQMPYVQSNATRFNWARSSACWTLPATTCLFTGKLSHEHGATSQTRGFHDHIPTLAEKLKGANYNTYQATANIVTTDIFGLDRGFDQVFRVWDNVESKFPFLLHILLMAGKPRIRKMVLSKDFMFQKMATDFKVGICWSQTTHQDIFNFVRQKKAENEAKGENSFFFLNLMEAHFPYHVDNTFKLTGDGIGDKFREAIGLFHTLNQTFLKTGKHPKKPEIEQLIRERQNKGWDMLANPIDEFIRELHEDEDNLVVLCSDHGDNFGDQEWEYHFMNVTDGGNRVPLLWLDHEHSEPKEINYPVSSRFIHHDILKAAGVPHEGGTLMDEQPENLPVLQSYWHNNDNKTLPEYRYNQLCFIDGDDRYVYRDDIDKNFKWLHAKAAKMNQQPDQEPVFEPVERGFDPIEEVLKDQSRKQYLRTKVIEFEQFSNTIPKHPKNH